MPDDVPVYDGLQETFKNAVLEGILVGERRGVQFLLDGLAVASMQELRALVEKARPTAEMRYMLDRGGEYSAAIGRARVALQDGDAEKASRVLDSVVEESRRQHFDACIEDGHPPETVELFLGPRDRSER
jgi:hypothetical protein